MRSKIAFILITFISLCSFANLLSNDDKIVLRRIVKPDYDSEANIPAESTIEAVKKSLRKRLENLKIEDKILGYYFVINKKKMDISVMINVLIFFIFPIPP